MSKNIGEKIKRIRAAEGLTQKEFFEAVKCSLSGLKNYEGGRRQPNLEMIQNICAAFPHYMWYLMQENMNGATVGQITPEETKVEHT